VKLVVNILLNQLILKVEYIMVKRFWIKLPYLVCLNSRGGLIKQSRDVVVLCKTAEQIFKSYQYKLSNIRNDPIHYSITKSMSKIQICKMFNCISDHILNQSPLNNHLLQLIHLALKTYFTVRLHHSDNTTREPKQRIRSFLTKTVHFKNQ